MMSEVAIEVCGATYAYPDGTVGLNDVTLKILKGERVAILGPNGAGKSTLLMIIDGLMTPNRGYVKIFGEILGKSTVGSIRRRVGFVFQDPDDMLFCPTIEDDIAFGPTQLDLPPDVIKARSSEVSRLLNMRDLMKKPPFRLSEGEKKKAALASSMVMKPDILLVDEPTSDLDSETRKVVIHLLNELNRVNKITLVIATQEVDLVPKIADRVCLMGGDNTIVGEGPAKDILSNHELMKRTGLSIPTIGRLFLLLNRRGLTDSSVIPLTMEEALDELTALLKRGR